MPATSALDLRILRALRARPSHGYALARLLEGEGPDRATVYRRLAALRAAGLVEAAAQRGAGPERKTYRLSRAGEERLRDELRAALALLVEAFADRLRRAAVPRPGRPALRAPVAFVSGSRLTGVELRIAGALAAAFPRKVHLVVPPGLDVGRTPAGLVVMEGSWSAIPLRDGHARTMLVNELPPARALARAVAEWARVLAPGGRLHVVAPAPLPRGVDPFVDFLADVRDELHPDGAGAPEGAEVARALARRFDRISERREADQRVWSATMRRATGSGAPRRTP